MRTLTKFVFQPRCVLWVLWFYGGGNVRLPILCAAADLLRDLPPYSPYVCVGVWLCVLLARMCEGRRFGERLSSITSAWAKSATVRM